MQCSVYCSSSRGHNTHTHTRYDTLRYIMLHYATNNNTLLTTTKNDSYYCHCHRRCHYHHHYHYTNPVKLSNPVQVQYCILCTFGLSGLSQASQAFKHHYCRHGTQTSEHTIHYYTTVRASYTTEEREVHPPYRVTTTQRSCCTCTVHCTAVYCIQTVSKQNPKDPLSSPSPPSITPDYVVNRDEQRRDEATIPSSLLTL